MSFQSFSMYLSVFMFSSLFVLKVEKRAFEKREREFIFQQNFLELYLKICKYIVSNDWRVEQLTQTKFIKQFKLQNGSNNDRCLIWHEKKIRAEVHLQKQ